MKEATKAEAANSFEVVAREWYGKQKIPRCKAMVTRYSSVL